MSTSGRMAGGMWRGTVPSMTLNCSPVVEGLCTTLRCRLHGQRGMIGDAMPRMMERLLPAPSYAALTGFERVIGDAQRILEARPYSKRLMITLRRTTMASALPTMSSWWFIT